MNINEGLKECAALKGKLGELTNAINKGSTIKEYVFTEVALPKVKQVESVSPVIKEYLKTVEDLETLKQRIYETNVKVGAVKIIHRLNYLKSVLPTLKNLSQLTEEEVSLESKGFSSTSNVIKRTVNFDLNFVKEEVVKIEYEIKQKIAELDRINFTTELD